MKTLLTVILILTLSNAIGQTVYDLAVFAHYENLYKKLTLHFRTEFDKISQDTMAEEGLAIFTQFECDTLNKTDQKKSQLPEIELIDVKTNKPVKSDSKKEKYPTLFCYGMLRNDTLGIQISGLFLDQGIMHYVTAKHLSISYLEHHKHEYILKINASDSLSSSLIVPVKISKFVLSNPDYKIGDIIYGSGEIITKSYFIKDGWNENHFYKMRWRLKYYFKCRITKNE
jgi:hypothetical protein